MPRWRVAAIAAAVALGAAALAIGLTRGGSTRLSWTPTESATPLRTVTLTPTRTYTFAQAVKAGVVSSMKEQEQDSGLPVCGTKPPASGKARKAYEQAVKRNDGDTCIAGPDKVSAIITVGTDESFFALNSVPVGHNSLRYVDSHGWAIVYPRTFHAVAYSTSAGTATATDGVTFANFTPVPETAGPPVLPNRVVLAITTSWNHVTGPARLGHNSRFPLRVPSSFETPVDGWFHEADFDFQWNGVAYRASLIAGPKASRADLEALHRMVESISFPPAGDARASGGRSPRGS